MDILYLVTCRTIYYRTDVQDDTILGLYKHFGEACRCILKYISEDKELDEYEEENIVNALINNSKFKMLYDDDIWIFNISKITKQQFINNRKNI